MKVILQSWKGYDRALIVAPNSIGSVFVEIYKTRCEEYCDKGVAWIWSLFVKRGKRRAGLAKALLRRAEEYARARHCHTAIIEWSETDSPRWVLEWYLRSGYSEMAIRETSLLLKKDLTDNG